MTNGAPSITAVVPCFNEEEGLHECHRRLSLVLSNLSSWYEIVYIDDGSHDGTLSELQRIYNGDSNVTVIELSRNFGHQAAVSAGLEIARGDVVLIIDADLQDPPELLSQMLEIWGDGHEVVYGVRDMRKGEGSFKLWSAKMFYRLIKKLSDVDIPVDAGDFRLLDRKAVDAMNRMPERHRLLRGMCSWIGFRQFGFHYVRQPRFAGETKYSLLKMINLALDGIVSFSTFPLRLLACLGFLAAAFASCGLLYSLFVRLFTHSWVQGWTTLFIGTLFLGGLQMISIGIVGEYVGRIYTEAKQRPLYLARSVFARRGNEIRELSDQDHSSQRELTGR